MIRSETVIFIGATTTSSNWGNESEKCEEYHFRDYRREESIAGIKALRNVFEWAVKHVIVIRRLFNFRSSPRWGRDRWRSIT